MLTHITDYSCLSVCVLCCCLSAFALLNHPLKAGRQRYPIRRWLTEGQYHSPDWLLLAGHNHRQGSTMENANNTRNKWHWKSKQYQGTSRMNLIAIYWRREWKLILICEKQINPLISKLKSTSQSSIVTSRVLLVWTRNKMGGWNVFMQLVLQLSWAWLLSVALMEYSFNAKVLLKGFFCLHTFLNFLYYNNKVDKKDINHRLFNTFLLKLNELSIRRIRLVKNTRRLHL